MFLSIRTAACLTEKGSDGMIRMMMISDRAGDRQGETGAATQRSLKLEAGLKSAD